MLVTDIIIIIIIYWWTLSIDKITRKEKRQNKAAANDVLADALNIKYRIESYRDI